MNDSADPIAQAMTLMTTAISVENIPESISARARHLMLDMIGCALAARNEEFSHRFYNALNSLAEQHSSKSGVIGYAERLPLKEAAQLNGALAHGLDYDDTHMDGIAHLSVSVFPSLLAMGGKLNTSGGTFLASYIAGLEAGARLASVAKGAFTARGFHPTAVIGTFASALAVGKLQGLSVMQLTAAQGIALSMASGSLQFLEDGAWTKRMHPGWAAQAGITAANFASFDLPSPDKPYLGRYGLYRNYLTERQFESIEISRATGHLAHSGIPDLWELLGIAVKPYPMCHFVHASIDAAVKLHSTGLNPDDIRLVTVLIPEGVVQSVCEPVSRKRRPATDYDAKFSIYYAVSSGLIRGKLGLQELDPSALQESEILKLMDRTEYVVDADSTFPKHYSGEVRVTLNDGTVLQQREPINRGHAEFPLTNKQIYHKYIQNATRNFHLSHAEEIADCVMNVDKLTSIKTLENLLSSGPV